MKTIQITFIHVNGADIHKRTIRQWQIVAVSFSSLTIIKFSKTTHFSLGGKLVLTELVENTHANKNVQHVQQNNELKTGDKMNQT